MNWIRHRRFALGGLALISLLATGATAASTLTLPSAAQILTAFKAVDTEGDGVLDLKEWDRASFALFRAADKNNDDFIDRDELQAAHLAPDTFLRVDQNRDGRLSVGEFTDLRRALFTITDIDRDDLLSLVEFELFILMERVGWQDANRNGRIEISELTASLITAFAGLDANADAELTEAESAYMRPKAFKRYDTNRDGRLTQEEFVQGYRTEMILG